MPRDKKSFLGQMTDTAVVNDTTVAHSKGATSAPKSLEPSTNP